MSGQPLLVANKGTAHELFIFEENGMFYVDNVSDYRGAKVWPEFPRCSSTVKGCKIKAAKIMCEPQVWSAPE